MKQLLQSLKDGRTEVIDVPVPKPSANNIVIKTRVSLISSGTERMLLEFGEGNMWKKVKSQPDKVKQVLEKMKTDGILATIDAVKSKLDQPIPVGYSNVGVVTDTGSNVAGFSPEDRVISNGCHAEMVSVPQTLCAKIPDSVPDNEAAFTVLGAIALQGIRLADPKIGESVAVIGAGIIGLLTIQILVGNGCRVIATDMDPEKLKLAGSFGAECVDISGERDPVSAAVSFSGGHGVDAVLITAATGSNEPVRQAARMCRKRGKIVLVGVTGLELSRSDFYEKELSFQVSCSYGPGRYDPDYEQKGHDYPIGYVRWTVKRNFEAVLDLMARGKINIKPLISETVPFHTIAERYSGLVKDRSKYGILIQYDGSADQDSRIIDNGAFKTTGSTEAVVAGMIGAGSFASQILLPAIRKSGVRCKTIASPGGTSGTIAGRKFNFEKITSSADDILNDPEINTVFIASRHDSHASLVCSALKAGKHVFVEKPLALSAEEIDEIGETISTSPERQLLVGYNRRFSPFARKMRQLVEHRNGPLSAVYTVNAGFIPPDHWVHDPATGGGRIIGEVCHFIDFLQFLTGEKIVSTYSSHMNEGEKSTHDTVTVTLEFRGGSTGTVHYFSNGSKKYPKERVTVFSDGRILELNNFKSLKGYGFKWFRRMSTWKQEKGHTEEISAFIERVKSGGDWLIPWESLKETSAATFRTADTDGQ